MKHGKIQLQEHYAHNHSPYYNVLPPDEQLGWLPPSQKSPPLKKNPNHLPVANQQTCHFVLNKQAVGSFFYIPYTKSCVHLLILMKVKMVNHSFIYLLFCILHQIWKKSPHWHQIELWNFPLILWLALEVNTPVGVKVITKESLNR